jgi:hypothetical protein
MKVQDKTDGFLLYYKSFAIHKRKLGKAFQALWIGALVSPRGRSEHGVEEKYMHTPARHRNLVVNPV